MNNYIDSYITEPLTESKMIEEPRIPRKKVNQPIVTVINILIYILMRILKLIQYTKHIFKDVSMNETSVKKLKIVNKTIYPHKIQLNHHYLW